MPFHILGYTLTGHRPDWLKRSQRENGNADSRTPATASVPPVAERVPFTISQRESTVSKFGRVFGSFNITKTNASARQNQRLNSLPKEKNVANALSTGTTTQDLEITRASPEEMVIVAKNMLTKLSSYATAEDKGGQHFSDEKLQRNKQRLSDTENILNDVRDEKNNKSLSFVVCHRNQQPVGILALNEKTGHVEDIVTLPGERGVSDALIEEAAQLTVASGNEPILTLKPLRPELTRFYERWGFLGSERKMYLYVESKWEWDNERWRFTENARKKIMNDMENYAGVS